MNKKQNLYNPHDPSPTAGRLRTGTCEYLAGIFFYFFLCIFTQKVFIFSKHELPPKAGTEETMTEVFRKNANVISPGGLQAVFGHSPDGAWSHSSVHYE